MKHIMRWMTGAAALAGVAAAGCGSEVAVDTHKGSPFVVQVGTMTADKDQVLCTDPDGGVEAHYDLTYLVEMVNTTSNDVTVTGISSNGQVVNATNQSDLGKAAHVFNALTWTPQPALVRAHDGDLTLRAPITVNCGTATVTAPFSRDILTTLVVTTTVGAFASPPVITHVDWVHIQLTTGQPAAIKRIPK